MAALAWKFNYNFRIFPLELFPPLPSPSSNRWWCRFMPCVIYDNSLSTLRNEMRFLRRMCLPIHLSITHKRAIKQGIESAPEQSAKDDGALTIAVTASICSFVRRKSLSFWWSIWGRINLAFIDLEDSRWIEIELGLTSWVLLQFVISNFTIYFNPIRSRIPRFQALQPVDGNLIN